MVDTLAADGVDACAVRTDVSEVDQVRAMVEHVVEWGASTSWSTTEVARPRLVDGPDETDMVSIARHELRALPRRVSGDQMVRHILAADLPTLVGQSLGRSPRLEVLQEDVDRFASVTRDDQWIHTDPVRAAAGPFGTTIAHGFFTLSLIPHLVHSTVQVRGIEMAINYGLNRCRFPSPVPVGSRVAADLALTEATPRDERTTDTVMTVTIAVDGADRPVCVAELVTRYVLA